MEEYEDDGFEAMNTERFDALIEELSSSLEKIGLYPVHMTVVGQATSFEDDDADVSGDVREMLVNGEAEFAVVGVWQLGDVAWSDRVLYPEQFDQDRQFQAMMPTEKELAVSAIEDALANGGDIYELDLDFLDGEG